MRALMQAEAQQVGGAMVSFGGISASKVRILVTDDSEFAVPSLLNGQQINARFYSDKVVDKDGQPLTNDLSIPFMHNGHRYEAQAVPGGHIYTIYFNQS